MRCGACNEVFDGNAALVVPHDLPHDLSLEPLLMAAPAPAASALQPQALPGPAPLEDKLAALDSRAATELHGEHETAIYTLELGSIDSDGEQAGADAASHADGADTAAQLAQPEPAAFAPATFAPAALHEHEAPTAPPAAADEAALDFDLDLNVDDEPPAASEAEPPAPAATEPPAALLPEVPPSPSEPEPELALELDVESMTDEELEAALAAELEAIAATEAELANEAEASAFADSFADTQAANAAAAAAAPAIDDAAAIDAAAFDDAHSIDLDAPPLDGALPPPDGRREPTWGEPPSEHLLAAAISDALHGHEDELLDEDEEALVQLSAGAMARAESEAAHSAAEDADTDIAVADAAPPAAEAATSFDEPGFVKRDRRKQKLRKAATVAMRIGSVLLVATLFGQVIATFRNPLAAYVPSLKQPLAQICAPLGCKIELPAQIDYVTIEQGELQTLTETTFLFTTLLRNQSTTAQAWPHIELILDDASDKAILRRVFAPRDYLPAGADPAQGFASHTEQSVKLYFELGQLKASGYHIAVFYP